MPVFCRSAKRVLRLASVFVAMAICSLSTSQGKAAEPITVLPLEGMIEPDGSAVRLSWTTAQNPRRGSAVVSRRILGQTGPETWEVVAPGLGAVVGFRDPDTKPGIAYEYRVQRLDIRTGTVLDSGYWTTGVDVPAVETRGTAFVVVDETVLPAIAKRLARFEMDLIGDGWDVVRLQSPRGDRSDLVRNLEAARTLKARIREKSRSRPEPPRALVLVGHVPIVTSGKANPDGHGQVANATDLFYADMQGLWRDDGNGVLTHNIVAGGAIDMLVGRIDFSNLADSNPSGEVHLLRSYLDRNHAWRHGLLGDLRQAYGDTDHLASELAALKNIAGPDAVTRGGHVSEGRKMPWLFGVDFGDPGARLYSQRYSNKTVFSINFGSHKHKIERRYNALTATLAQPWYALATGWGARPAWHLHHMAMGRSMGESLLRTVNNGRPRAPYPGGLDYVPTGGYVMRNVVWTNLLGDPTVRPFPLLPPRNLSVTLGSVGMDLAWTPPDTDEVTGFRLYRAPTPTGPYRPVGDGTTIAGHTATDPDGLPHHWYMIRAIGRKSVHAGSFFTLSQGVFAQAGRSALTAPDRALAIAPGDRVRILPPPHPEGPDGPAMLAPLVGAANASVTQDDDGWWLEPLAGFAGDIAVPYMASDGFSSASGTITITVGDQRTQ